MRRAARIGGYDGTPLKLKKGQIIAGKYRIEEELGCGGMGAVFRATHMISDKAVALKWLLRPISDHEAPARRAAS